ncbi:MAG: glycosyltransferase [Flavobacteriales bacterium]|nr:glycosyltransferase [Flavobacteriales bacterium]
MGRIENEDVKMKKILILSYHFPPMNVIASQRALGYANHFKKFGLDPTVLTFDWNKTIQNQYCSKRDFDKRIIYENYENYKVIRIPVIQSFWFKIFNFFSKLKMNKLMVLLSWAIGGLDSNYELYNFRLSELRFLSKNCQNYDLAISIFSPHFHARNLYKIHRFSNLPYIIDHRDLWSNRILHKYYHPKFKMKVQDYFISYYWKKWEHKSMLSIITSSPWADKLEEIVSKPVLVITNGFDPKELDGIRKVEKKENDLSIVHVGSIYSQQKLEVFLEGLRDFVLKNKRLNIHVYFIGAERSNSKSGVYSFEQDIRSRIDRYLSCENYTITERVERKDALEWMANADVLYFPSFPDTPGTYSGKIFEYLMVGKPILMVPNDNDVCSSLIMETMAGNICSSPSEVTEFFERFVTDNKAVSSQIRNHNKIDFYTRENQTRILANEILKRLN